MVKEKHDNIVISNTRNVNMDIIRVVALIFVISLHFFLYSGFYDQVLNNTKMVIMTFIRNLFLTCIPLFLLLTGYLKGNKKIDPTKRYYLKIFNIIGPYIIICCIYLIYVSVILKEEHPIRYYIENFTAFDKYSWYINMYIGLYLLIPFLNIIWQNLKSKKQEHILLITMFILIIAPSIFNFYQLDSKDWFSASNESYWSLFPNWWTNAYPLAYYFTGAYLAKHKDDHNIKPLIAFSIFIGSWAIWGTYTVLRCWNISANFYSWLNYNSWGAYVVGISLFIFINSINFKSASKFMTEDLVILSKLSFGAYLSSWIVDQYLYDKHINIVIPNSENRIWAFIPCVLLTAIVAYSISLAVDMIYRACVKFILYIIKHVKKTKPDKQTYE